MSLRKSAKHLLDEWRKIVFMQMLKRTMLTTSMDGGANWHAKNRQQILLSPKIRMLSTCYTEMNTKILHTNT